MDLRMIFLYSVARLTAKVPWLCVPDSHRVCPYRRAEPADVAIIPQPESVYITCTADPNPTKADL